MSRNPDMGWFLPFDRMKIKQSHRSSFLFRLPLLPIFQPLLGVPVMVLSFPEDIGMDERPRPAPFRRKLISGRVDLEGESQRQRRLWRGFLPSLIAGEPAAGEIAETRQLEPRDFVFHAVEVDHTFEPRVVTVLDVLDKLAV